VIVCLVTDRCALGWSVDELVAHAGRAVAAGVDLIQIRERDLEARDLAALTAAVVAMARGTATKVLVNDRLDVALAAGADGVHLRSDSIQVRAARRLRSAPFLIGRSVHSVDDARAAADADYLIAGTVFPTASKPDATRWLGLDGLRAIVRTAVQPVLAIGGVTRERLADVAATGAAGVAAIRFLAPSGASELEHIVAGARRLFDSAKTAP
jgi:thiamine-phosphate diphosphorylase